jgi:acyl carrier protein
VAVPTGVASLPHAADDTPEPAFALGALGRLWTGGVLPESAALHAAGGRDSALGAGARALVERRAGSLSTAGAGPAGRIDPPPGVASSPPRGTDDDDGHGDVARVLAGLWRDLLGADAGPDDDFFLLGGHSLAAAKLIVRVRERFGVEMRLRTLFRTRTVAAMSRWIADAAQTGEGGPAHPAPGPAVTRADFVATNQ